MITININSDHLNRVQYAKSITNSYTIKPGFKKWLKYLKQETYKTYIDNLNR